MTKSWVDKQLEDLEMAKAILTESSKIIFDLEAKLAAAEERAEKAKFRYEAAEDNHRTEQGESQAVAAERRAIRAENETLRRERDTWKDRVESAYDAAEDHAVEETGAKRERDALKAKLAERERDEAYRERNDIAATVDGYRKQLWEMETCRDAASTKLEQAKDLGGKLVTELGRANAQIRALREAVNDIADDVIALNGDIDCDALAADLRALANTPEPQPCARCEKLQKELENQLAWLPRDSNAAAKIRAVLEQQPAD